MEKFSALQTTVTPLPCDDLDTDQIIPARFLRRISRNDYGEALFRDLRDNKPDFPVNQARYQGSQILAAGGNFGCGSSREHAVWAIAGYGFKAVIAKSFADIFFQNAWKNGLLAVSLPQDDVDFILEAAARGEYTINIDLEAQEVSLPSRGLRRFECDPFRRFCVLNGLDDLSYLEQHYADIADWRRMRRAELFFSTAAFNNPAAGEK